MNLPNEKVSVIIPVYNSAKFLKTSIDSILNQTYKNVEIVAVDDGSTDRSPEILKNYSDRISTVFKPNQGLASALNVGIKNITGIWFKWFSPDDILYPDSIETCLQIARTLPKNTIVYSNWELIDEKGNKMRNFFESNYNNLANFDFNVRLLDGQQININTALIPSALLNMGCKICYLEEPVAIDYDFFLQAGILYGTKFHLVPRSLIKYRIHKAQLSHQHIVKSLSSLPKVRNDILSRIDIQSRKKYEKALEEYNHKKPISKKILRMGLNLSSILFPEKITDRMLLFYLNKLRQTR